VRPIQVFFIFWQKYNLKNVFKNFFRIPAGKPPRFPKKPTIRQDEDAITEEMILIMECILEANPGPEIRWYRGDTEIKETTPRYKMSRKKTARDQYTLTLEIRAPTQEDGGQYRCNAVNTFGESNANIALNFAGNFVFKKNYHELYIKVSYVTCV
jgi:Immunoglobulin I-set domain